jgi:hypothetical protein
MKYSSVKFRQRYTTIIKAYKWHDLGSELKFYAIMKLHICTFFRKALKVNQLF